MERQHIIVLQKDDVFETWGSLVELCEVHGFKYHSLKAKKFPFEHQGYKLIKTEYRKKVIS
tara:strand:- start:47336 stop:47518 length:183 start_codon:yes stop_codon:yes gene_type:complete